MKNKDMLLMCQRCRSQFYFTVGEQNFYKQKGLNIPKLCKQCRCQKQFERTVASTPRACSTCYFSQFGRCTRTNGKIINDAPCKHWTARKAH